MFLTGCGTFVTNRQKEHAAQSLSDAKAALEYVADKYSESDPPTMWAALAAIGHAENVARVMDIDLEDLPRPRITKRIWQIDPQGAQEESRALITQDKDSIVNYTLYGLSAVSLAVLLGRLGHQMLGNHPIGILLGQLGHIFGGESPRKKKVFDTIVSVMDEYKKVDPNWRNNKLFEMLSDSMTSADKDFVKSQRNV